MDVAASGEVSQTASAVLTLATMTIPSYRAIENLIASYAELVDHGDFAGVGVLLADATFTGFPGGTADLNFDFTIENDHIRALKIAP